MRHKHKADLDVVDTTSKFHNLEMNCVLPSVEPQSGHTVRGQATFDDGTPCSYIWVSLLYNRSPYVYKAVQTDKNGVYEIKNVKKGKYYLEFSYRYKDKTSIDDEDCEWLLKIKVK